MKKQMKVVDLFAGAGGKLKKREGKRIIKGNGGRAFAWRDLKISEGEGS